MADPALCESPGSIQKLKNGDEQFWKRKFHAANGKGSTCTHERSSFFFFEGRGIFKKLPLFPSSSQRVLKFPYGGGRAGCGGVMGVYLMDKDTRK